MPRPRGQVGPDRLGRLNKAADQSVVLDERTEREMAKGRFKKEPEAAGMPWPSADPAGPYLSPRSPSWS